MSFPAVVLVEMILTPMHICTEAKYTGIMLVLLYRAYSLQKCNASGFITTWMHSHNIVMTESPMNVLFFGNQTFHFISQ